MYMQKVARVTNKKATVASYRVLLKMAEIGAARTIAENFIKPSAFLQLQ
jgi:hypothetical protein